MTTKRPVRRVLASILRKTLVVLLLLVAWLWLPTTIRYHITEHYQLQSTGADSHVFLGVMLPKTGPYQRVENLTISWEENRSLEEHPEIDVVKLTGDVRPPGTLAAAIAYDVVLWQGRARWDGPVEDWQVQPQKDIESDAAVLIKKAAELTDRQSRDDAYRVFDFASRCLSEPKGDRVSFGEARQSALKAYETGEGGCGEFANLTAALCRAAKIPSKSISGIGLMPYQPF